MIDVYSVCIHEAAHACADLALGIGVIELGHAGDRGWSRARGPTTVLSCLAGPAAEWRLTHDDAPSIEAMRLCRDDPDVARAIVRLGSDDPVLLVACWRAAVVLVDQHWAAILRVAAALEARGTLTGDEAEQVWCGQLLPA